MNTYDNFDRAVLLIYSFPIMCINSSAVNNITRSSKRTNSPTFHTLLENTVSVALFNYGRLHTFMVSKVTLLTMAIAVKAWVQL
jgi:hypothetical protein